MHVLLYYWGIFFLRCLLLESDFRNTALECDVILRNRQANNCTKIQATLIKAEAFYAQCRVTFERSSVSNDDD